MGNKKNVREKRKIRFSEYFKELKNNDKVAVIQEKSIPSSYPRRIVGMTGNVVGSKGKFKRVKIMDGNLSKEYIIHPIHLKRLK